jgi:hypothetical protein
MSIAILKGVIHGKTIELEQEPELPDGQRVSVQVQPEEQPPKWLERFTVDRSIALGKLLPADNDGRKSYNKGIT